MQSNQAFVSSGWYPMLTLDQTIFDASSFASGGRSASRLGSGRGTRGPRFFCRSRAFSMSAKPRSHQPDRVPVLEGVVAF